VPVPGALNIGDGGGKGEGRHLGCGLEKRPPYPRPSKLGGDAPRLGAGSFTLPAVKGGDVMECYKAFLPPFQSALNLAPDLSLVKQSQFQFVMILLGSHSWKYTDKSLCLVGTKTGLSSTEVSKSTP
jgi:hypothetical protein